jgi:sugar phosphate permease
LIQAQKTRNGPGYNPVAMAHSEAFSEADPYQPPKAEAAPSPPRATSVRISVSAWLAMAAVIAYLCRNSIMVAEKTIRLETGLTEDQMGWILGPAFFWTYALTQIPTAWLGERFGSRRCLPCLSAAWSLATAAFGLVSGFGWMLGNRMLVGLAQAGLFPCSTQTISRWHPQTERALASGTLAAAMSIGGAIGAVLTGWLLGIMSWQAIFALYAVPGLIWSVGFWWWFRETPAEHTATNSAERKYIAQGKADVATTKSAYPASWVWLSLVLSVPAWLICVQQFFRAAGYAFFSSWFATYLQETRGISTAASGLLTGLPLLAIVLSSTLGGGLSDHIFRRTGSLGAARKGVASVSLLGCAILVFSAYWADNATLAVTIISLGVFCSGFAGPCAYAVTIDMGGRHVAAFFSTMNMVGNVGAGLLPWLVPKFKAWLEVRPGLLSLVGGDSWNGVLFLFAAMYLAAALCWLLLRTNGSVFEQSFWPLKFHNNTLGTKT